MSSSSVRSLVSDYCVVYVSSLARPGGGLAIFRDLSWLLPVYYRADGAGVTASSDAADLGRRGGVDYPAVARFLANGGAPSRETCLEGVQVLLPGECRSEEHTSELQSLMRISYAVFCLNKKKKSQEIEKQLI